MIWSLVKPECISASVSTVGQVPDVAASWISEASSGNGHKRVCAPLPSAATPRLTVVEHAARLPATTRMVKTITSFCTCFMFFPIGRFEFVISPTCSSDGRNKPTRLLPGDGHAGTNGGFAFRVDAEVQVKHVLAAFGNRGQAHCGSAFAVVVAGTERERALVGLVGSRQAGNGDGRCNTGGNRVVRVVQSVQGCVKSCCHCTPGKSHGRSKDGPLQYGTIIHELLPFISSMSKV